MRKDKKAKKANRFNSKKSFFIALLISFAVVATGFEICFYFIKKLGMAEAERIGLMSTSHVASLVDDEFRFVTTSINLMLEGMIVEPDLNDIEKTRADTLFKTRRHYLKNLSQDKLYINLEYLLSKNKLCSAAAFIFEKETVEGTEEKGIALKVNKDGYVRENMLESFDVFNSLLYNRAYNNKRTFFKLDGYRPDDSTNFVCYAIPIWDEDADDLLGEFWVYIESSDLLKLVNSYAKADSRTIYEMCDKSERFMCAVNPGNVGRTVYDYLYEYNPEQADYYYKKLKQDISSGRAVSNFAIDDIPYTLAMVKLPYTGFVIFSYLESEHVYQAINFVRDVCRLIYFISLLIVIACSLFAFSSYKRTADEKIKIDRDLAIAKRIQENYLPKSVISCRGVDMSFRYRPARSVGGDLVDFYEREGKLYFCLGDVEGKGIPASMTMAVICSHFRDAVRYEKSAAAIAERMNAILSQRNDTMTFCTIVIGVYDLDSGLLHYCNAGHTHSVFRRSDGICSYIKGNPCFPLGVFEDAEYADEIISFEKGDMIYLYSDGITEARSKTKKMFGSEHLLEAIQSPVNPTSDDVIDSVFDAVDVFSNGEEQSDDITTLCIRRV